MSYLNYLIEANLALIFFYAMYWLLLRNENQFAVQRLVLIGGVLLSLVFPILDFKDLQPGAQAIIPSLNETFSAHVLPELTVSNITATESEITTSFNYWQILSWSYVTVVILLLTWLIYRVIQIIALMFRSTKITWKGLTVYQVDQEITAFSFFRLIYIGNKPLSTAEKEKILLHEYVHAKQLHSLDIILLKLVRILFWFNPLISRYEKALMQIHEFEADSKAITPEETDEYCYLLAKTALQSSGISVANHFSNSLSTKRIAMLRTLKSRIKNWKLAGIAIFMGVILGVIGCQDQLETSAALREEQLPKEVLTALKAAREEFPSAEIEVSKAGEEDKNFKPSQISLISTKEGKYMILIKDSRLNDYPKDESSNFFSYVEEKAKPLGGMERFYSSLLHAIIYPSDARQNKLEDKVYVEFIVNTNGTLSDIKVLKGKYESLNIEAERVLLQMGGTWTPAIHEGKIVRQKFILPITFSLSSYNKGKAEIKINQPYPTQIMNTVYFLTPISGGKVIEGFVSDPFGKPLEDVSILLNGQSHFTTANDGRFKFTTTLTSGTIAFSHPVFRNGSPQNFK